jgi:hypothetical protein
MPHKIMQLVTKSDAFGIFTHYSAQMNILIWRRGWRLQDCMKTWVTACPHIFHFSVTWRCRGLSLGRERNLTSLLRWCWRLLCLHLRNRGCLWNRRCWWRCTRRSADYTIVLFFSVCALRFGSAFYNIWQPTMHKIKQQIALSAIKWHLWRKKTPNTVH